MLGNPAYCVPQYWIVLALLHPLRAGQDALYPVQMDAALGNDCLGMGTEGEFRHARSIAAVMERKAGERRMRAQRAPAGAPPLNSMKVHKSLLVMEWHRLDIRTHENHLGYASKY
jgi:hypothetical protein